MDGGTARGTSIKRQTVAIERPPLGRQKGQPRQASGIVSANGIAREQRHLRAAQA